MVNIIEFRQVSLQRQNRAILTNINLKIQPHKITAIMGPSGCGKTTILRLITGQLKPSSGQVLVDGVDISCLTKADLYTLRKKIGLLFQSGALFNDLSVFENVAFPYREHTNLSDPMINDLVVLKLEAVGLREARDLYPHELSGGMSRRVAMARALAMDPKIMLYDEPFAGQDPITLGVLARLIQEINSSLSTTTIIVSHDIHETLELADYVYLLADRKIMAEGTPQLIQASADPWVKQFFCGQFDGPVPFHYKRHEGETLAAGLGLLC